MKFSEHWLREWVSPALTSAELSHQVTMAGLEVDAMTPVAPEFKGVVVGEVLAVAPHPDAERLRVCQVNVGQANADANGESQPLSIVCGAANVRAGLPVYNGTGSLDDEKSFSCSTAASRPAAAL